MLKLSDFFQPLNFVTLSSYLGLFFFFDVLGTFIMKKFFQLKEVDNFRIVNWLLGFGFFIFVWFLLSLVIALGRPQILISIVILLGLTIPSYIKDRSYKTLFKSLWDLKIPIVIIAFFLPAVFVKASLPPYFSDEMAYHYISPFALNFLAPIRYVGYLYGDIPRALDLFWQMVFTLLHTYSVARLFHFTILATSMLFAYGVLKRNFGFLTAFLFVFIFFSIPQDIIFYSTLGFVDIGAMSFLLIGLISGLDFVLNHSKSSLMLAISFWAMSLGTKYTGISSFVVFFGVLLAIIVLNAKKFFRIFSKQLILKLAGIFLIFGGFWYIKNFILYGNPIFPFLFRCWGENITTCPLGSSFFGVWTAKINLSTIYSIFDSLFPNDYLIQGLILATPFLALFGRNKKVNLMVIITFFSVLIELVILKYFSGFYLRYQQYIQLYLLLGVVIVLGAQYRSRLMNVIIKFLILILVIMTSDLYMSTLTYTYTKWISSGEVKYAIGQSSIYDWVNDRYPNMNYFTKWCENPSEGKYTPVEIIEPEIVRHNAKNTDVLYLLAYATNCKIDYPDFTDIPLGRILLTLKEQKRKFWIESTNSCILDKTNFPIYSDETETDALKIKENNTIICNSTKVGPHLYYFDYERLK